MDYFKNACRLHTHFMVHRYLISNTTGRLDGAEKAIRHAELCKFYVAAVFNYPFEDRVRIDHEDEYQAVHDATQELTDYLDEKIGFPIDDSRPDYDELAPKFFELFHRLAMRALAGAIEKHAAIPFAHAYRFSRGFRFRPDEWNGESPSEAIPLFTAAQRPLLPNLPDNLIEGLEDYEQTINVGDVSGCGDVILDTTTMTAAKILRQIYSIK